MAFLNALSDIGKSTPFGGSGPDISGHRLYWGKVVNNEDPKMNGLIKVAFFEFMPWFDREGEEAGKLVLPWICPLYPASLGQGPLTGAMLVPEEESRVVCIFPYNTPYIGFYVWRLPDHIRRNSVLLANYPERYGEVDSRYNSKITDKSPDVDAIERRYADGGFSLYDSKDSTNLYTDTWGTRITIDRKNQVLNISFGGVTIRIMEGHFKVESKDIDFYTRGGNFNVKSTLGVNITAKTISLLGKTFADIMSTFKNQTPR